MKMKQLALAGMVAASVGHMPEVSALTAMTVAMDFKGYVTMLDPTGGFVQNTSFLSEPKYQGRRTPIAGRMVMDITETGLVGSATFEPFLFFGIQASGRDVSFVPEDNLFGTPLPSNTLLVGNMLFDFGPTTGIPVSIVLDMGNLSTALMSSSVGDVITGLMTAASDNTTYTNPDGTKGTAPLGPVVVATTTWDTTDADTDGDGQPGPVVMNTNPSGTVPLLVDTVVDMTNGDVGIGGSPMRAGPFTGFNANFDITEITVTCVGLLGNCALPAPPLPLSAEPVEPVRNLLGGLVKKLGL